MISSLLIALNMMLANPDSSLHIKVIDSIASKADFITTDPIGNVYLIKGSVVSKYSAKGDSIISQNFNQIRTIEFFDASQSLKIYAVNYSFNTLAILDNTLSTQNHFIQFDKIPVDQVSLLCASNLNSTIWIFDAVNMQLVNVDQNFRVLNASVNFYSHNDLAGIPNYMTESENKLYINIPENGIKVFNQYCNFVQNIPVKTDKKIVVRNQKVYYIQNGEIVYYNMQNFTFGKVELGIYGIEDFSIEKNKLYCKRGNEILIIDATYDF